MIDKAVCHHCGHKNKIIKDCKIDGKKCEFLMYGPGVEKVYEELKKNYPQKNIKIFSSDYLSQKKNKTIIKKIENKFDRFLNDELNLRKKNNLPPFKKLIAQLYRLTPRRTVSEGRRK